VYAGNDNRSIGALAKIFHAKAYDFACIWVPFIRYLVTACSRFFVIFALLCVHTICKLGSFFEI